LSLGSLFLNTRPLATLNLHRSDIAADKSDEVVTLTISAGIHDLDNSTERTQVVLSQEVYTYDAPDARTASDDIVLIRLSSMLTFSSSVNSICLPTAGEVADVWSVCLTAGWKTS